MTMGRGRLMTAHTKYHNVKTRGYDSAREARRAGELRLLERAGEIRDLREQVRFELIPAIYTDDAGRLVPSSEMAPAGGMVQTADAHKLSSREVRSRGLWCMERRCEYVADFVYRDRQGRLVVEDVKGVRTKEYIIKKKLMLWVYGIEVKEV